MSQELTAEQKHTITAITVKFASLGIDASYAEPVTCGPIVTTYRFMPKLSTKVATIVSLSQDIAITLGVEDVTIRRIPGEPYIGVTVPNGTREIVLWRDTLGDTLAGAFRAEPMNVPLNLGVDSEGKLFRVDLAQLPHLLMAGSTGSGKSTLLSSIIASLIYWRSPQQIRLVLSDTKQVEFPAFVGSQHLTCLPLASVYQTLEAMDMLIDMMEQRLQKIAGAQCRNIHEYIVARPNDSLPFYVFVVDELADLLAGADSGTNKLAQQKLGTIVQKSRATGVYVIAATQRSSVNIVSGSIKANFPARLSFRLPSEADSRTVLGHSGAEHLLSRGDMWFISPLSPASRRLHSAYADVEDIRQCVAAARLMWQQPSATNVSQSTHQSSQTRRVQ